MVILQSEDHPALPVLVEALPVLLHSGLDPSGEVVAELGHGVVLGGGLPAVVLGRGQAAVVLGRGGLGVRLEPVAWRPAAGSVLTNVVVFWREVSVSMSTSVR